LKIKPDLIVNASLPNFNLNVMQVCLKVKSNYIDFCSLLKDLITPEQLSLHEDFKKAGLLAIINAGVSPGLTNIIAKQLSSKLDSIESINFRILEDQDQQVYSWSPEVILDELISQLNFESFKKSFS